MDRDNAITTLDLSVILRQVMAARNLSVADMAERAGVSKSAMEKYLAGPSSPRATAIASLSRSLGISADRLMFGELDPHLELSRGLAFKTIADLIQDLKNPEVIGGEFTELDKDTKVFEEFVRNTAYDRAGDFAAKLRDKLHEMRHTRIVVG